MRTETTNMDGTPNYAAINDSNELEPRTQRRPTPTGDNRYRRQSDIPTVPAPRTPTDQEIPADTKRRILAAYRRESARLVRIAAELKEMGIDPSGAWDGGASDVP